MVRLLSLERTHILRTLTTSLNEGQRTTPLGSDMGIGPARGGRQWAAREESGDLPGDSCRRLLGNEEVRNGH